MPTLDRDEPAFLVECESVPLSPAPTSPGASGDFGKDSRLSSYGSTSTSSTTSLTGPSPPAPPPPPPTLPKDPEQWALLGAVLPPPGGWAKSSIPPGLSAAEVLPLAQDPFWRRLRACFMALFWGIMVALLSIVVYIVVTDPKPCGMPGPPMQSLNVSMPLAAMPVLQVISASRY